MRDMLFVSHANPEDNEFALWLSLRLAAEGYPVWCDLTKLLGGELFWPDIEHAIRERTIKFLYVLTRISNHKPGPRNELAIAVAVERKADLKDFVIPMTIDDLPPGDFNVEVFRRNCVSFRDGWAGGLARVLKKLADDAVPKKRGFGAFAVSEWWTDHMMTGAGLQDHPEPLYSNWYPLNPATLYFHELDRDDAGPLTVTATLPYPAVQHEQYLVSFAPAEDFAGGLGTGLHIRASRARRVNDPDSANEPRLWTLRDERRVMSELLRRAVERLFEARSLPLFTFANGHKAFYFKKGMLAEDRSRYTNYDGERTWRAMIGFKTMSRGAEGNSRLRYWHFSLEPRPTSNPVIGYTMKPHVLFSDDGATIWESKERLHAARRSQCKDWWNDRWRDLIAAAVSFLAGEADDVLIPVGRSTTVAIAARPIVFQSPVSFDEATLEPQEIDERDADAEDFEEEAKSDDVDA